MAYMSEEDGRQILRMLSDKKVWMIMEQFTRKFKNERQMREGFALLENGTGKFSQSEFGVWTRVVGLAGLKPAEVNQLFAVLDVESGSTGFVPEKCIMDMYKRFKDAEDEQGEVPEEASKLWLTEQRQRRELLPWAALEQCDAVSSLWRRDSMDA